MDDSGVLSFLDGRNPDDYMQEALGFIARYKWLHDFKLIRFLADDVFDRLPNEWLHAFDSLSDGELQEQLDCWVADGGHQVPDSFPDSLCSFLQEAKRLSLNRKIKTVMRIEEEGTEGLQELEEPEEVAVPRHLTYGMSPKKLHEVSRMAFAVDKLCRERNIRTIVDLGAGKGYLDCVLSEVLSYKVIAIESDKNRTTSAKNRAVFFSRKKLEITENLHHVTMRIDGSEESINSLREIISEFGADKKAGVCLIGLHCCGDFTPMFFKTFAALQCATVFLCVGCCYHLMEVTNIPLSSAGVRNETFFWPEKRFLLTVSSLRLASQETKVKWLREMETHVQCHFFRAVLDVVADKMGLSVRRRKRHTTIVEDLPDFEKYLAALAENFEIKGCENFNAVVENIREEGRNCAVHLQKLRVFRILQGIVQNVLETFIIMDRFFYVKDDLKIGFVALFPLFEESISPRNLAIIGTKVF